MLEIVPLQSAANRKGEEFTELDDEAMKQCAEGNVTQNNTLRPRQQRSLLQSIKLRISGERSEVAGIRTDQDSSLYETRTLQILQCLLPNLSSRPYSSVASVTESLLRLKRRSGMAALDKAKTFLTVNPTARFNFKDDAEKSIVDINELPQSFRQRSGQISGDYLKSMTIKM